MKNYNIWDIITTIAAIIAVVMSLLAFFQANNANNLAAEANKIAINSNQIAIIANQISSNASKLANEANNIALKANQYYRESYVPMINAIIISDFHEEENIWTNTVEIKNVGQPLNNIRCFSYSILEISCDNTSSKTYLRLFNYFSNIGNYTGNGQGLLYTNGLKSNESKYVKVADDFSSTAYFSGNTLVYIRNIILLKISYTDTFGEYYETYLESGIDGNFRDTDKLEAQNLLDQVLEYYTIFFKYAVPIPETGYSIEIPVPVLVQPVLDYLDGTKLWNWYKTEILKK